MSKSSGVLLKKFSNNMEAELAKQTLSMHGIFSLIQYSSIAGGVIAGYKTGAPGFGVGEWGLYIKSGDEEKARGLLAEIFNEPENEKKPIDLKKGNKDFLKFFILFLLLTCVLPFLIVWWMK